MDRIRKKFLLFAAFGAFVCPAQGAPTQWTAAAGGNDHWYEFFSAGAISWDDARSNALGAGGYLATITSGEENTFVTNLVPTTSDSTAWLGASDIALEGSFRWMDGPEAGSTLTYTNFAPGEPNNVGGTEHYVAIYGLSTPFPCCQRGLWNDAAGNSTGYVLEWTALPVPEPGAYALMLAGLGLVSFAASRRKRR
jgi:hypothetical protein